jgi:Dolichyl-phosphate-mannose-protein mannosyltransferase
MNRRIAGAIFAATLIVLSWAGHTQGNVRDEGYYFDAAEQYYGWYGELGDNLLAGHPLRSFSRGNIDKWFGYNHEHPALMKTLFGFSWRLFHKCHCPKQGGRHPVGYAKAHRTLPILDEEAAMRLPTDILVALMAAVLYLWAAAAFSRAAGVVAAVLGVMAPRLFFDAQLATFDAPIAALWVLVVYAYWRALADRRWGWRAGVLFGLALATKHNAFFIPFILAVHFAWVAWRQKRLPNWRVFAWMAGLGLPVYLACWPWLWFSTVPRFREYVAFHVHHVYYNMEYLGRNYNKPPFPLSFPYVMTALTLPVTTLALALGGVFALARRRDPDSPATGLLIGLNALFPMAIITVTRAPIFGATKHWHAAIPFLALLAAAAVYELQKALNSRRWAVILAVAACAPAVAETWRSHPYGLTHYNMLAGGPPGGADLGMNRQFWGYATRGLLPWLNAHAPAHAPIYWHDTNQAQLNMDVRIGLLRDDVWNTGLEEPGVKASNIAMVIHEKHFNKYEYWIWDFYGTARPSLVLDDEGVPIVTLYERPRK